MDINQKKPKITKSFGLTTLSLNNKVTVYVITVLIVTFGLLTYVSLPKESFPEVKQPLIYIGTPYPGNSPIDIENLVTRPIEKEINTVADVDNVKSTSVQDYSTVLVEFTAKTDIDDALVRVKDAIDKAKPDLPSDLPSDPNVFEMNFSEFPVLNINLSGDYSMERLNEWAEYLQEEIEKVPQISYCEIRGVDEKEVRINVDPYQMEAREVNFTDIENAIRYENTTLSGGSMKEGDIRRTIRVIGEFKDPLHMLDVVVKAEKGNIVYLRDIAEVEFDYKEKENYARLKQNPVVMVDVIKRSGENLLIATESINEILAKAYILVFPADLLITITNDQSEQTRDMVNSLQNNIVSGVILVVLVLLFFLGSRNALFVGVAIPLSMFMSFIILGAFDITINMMVLFSLIMALGMLVDNGIVVVENVYRLREQGYNAYDATKKGVGEVALPIIASTATTVAAFLPLAFWPGLIGQFMKYLPITLMVTLGSSLFVALVINPVLISTFMKLANEEANKRKIWVLIALTLGMGVLFFILKLPVLSNILFTIALVTLLNIYLFIPGSKAFRSRVLPKLERLYKMILNFSLRGKTPAILLIGSIFLMVTSISLFSYFLNSPMKPNMLFFPKTPPKYVNVFVEFPLGTDIEGTNEYTKKVEEVILEVVSPYQAIVESVISNVGQGTADPSDPSSMGANDTPNKSRIMVNFVEFKERNGLSTAMIMKKIRNRLEPYPGVTVTVNQDATGPPTGKPINIEITGEDFETLVKISTEMKNMINESGIEGIEKLKTDLQTGKPEMVINIDREKARRFGLATSQIAAEVRTSLFGKEISTYKDGEDDYEVQLRLQDKYRYDIDALMAKSIVFRDPSNGQIKSVPISSVATANISSTYGSIKRKDLLRQVTISSNVLDAYNPTKINNEIKTLLADYKIPLGYNYQFGGEQERQAEELAFLNQAFLVALFLIFLIIVSQFNKITTPFIIMMSVMLSTIGVFLGLVVFQMDFIVIMTMIGIISLAGIVVNNAIVLIDFIELTKKRISAELGIKILPFDKIVEAITVAGTTRLRPVLLTAITTILGLIPLAVGINIDFIKFFSEYDADFYLGGDNVAFWGPMSWTIIFGLTFATFLTLVIVPIMYLGFARLNRKLGIS